jgi:hypothetical protein
MTTTLSHTDATRLDGAQRLTFLPSLFSSDFMLSELSVYAYASRYIDGYNGDSGSTTACRMVRALWCRTGSVSRSATRITGLSRK